MSGSTGWGSVARRSIVAALLAVLAFVVLAPRQVARVLVRVFDESYAAPSGPLEPKFDGPDAARDRVAVRLVPVADGFERPTDLAFVPGEPTVMVVTEKGGGLRWVDLADRARGDFGRLEVLTASEEGLLGLAFHPRFPTVPELFLDVVQAVDGEDRTVVLRCTVPGPVRGGRLGPCETVLEQPQPYQNHNAGQLAFGPDGRLFVGFGDGGFRGDPLGAGQDPTTWLGKMLRIDIDSARPYAVPDDNPFVGQAGTRPEIWAFGLRNPWRFTLAPDGRLIVADVGQDAWEEVSVAARGANLGWSRREGRVCYPKADVCDAPAGHAGGVPPGEFTEPLWVYGRDEGQSITGGVVATGSAVSGIVGRYVFGDFVTGRLWALNLPVSGLPTPPVTLGRWPILPVAFARDPAGDVVVADFGKGVVYALRAP